jgi:large subunit ribosomal protein L25
MAAAATKNIQLALALPARLRTFLARYPPASILPAGANPETHKTAYQEETPNPFLPMKHPVTGRWHDPKYSLRRQAELVKLAREHGVEELLPYTPKGTETRLRKRVELGLRVKGTGVGQKVKGHKHERQLGAKYVWIRSWVWLGSVLGLQMADSAARQDGEEERGHAQDAGAHQGMEKGMFWRPMHTLLGTLANPSVGWETGLDQVSEIGGQTPSGDDAVMCLDCTNTNVQHLTTGWSLGCGS